MCDGTPAKTAVQISILSGTYLTPGVSIAKANQGKRFSVGGMLNDALSFPLEIDYDDDVFFFPLELVQEQGSQTSSRFCPNSGGLVM